MPISNDHARLLQQYFDKIFIVSIPRFADRHERVAANLQGLQYDFFWGADKQELSLQQAEADGVYDELRTRQLQRQGKPLNLGELACSLSHRKLYEEMVKHNWKRVLILEDDVLPLYDNLQYLPAALQELPDDWELLYLGYLKHEQVTIALKLKQFFYKIISVMGLMAWNYKMVNNFLPKPFSAHLKKAGFHDCTHAYALSLSGAKKLLEVQTPVVYRADDLLSATIMKGELKAFVTEPKFFDQEIFHNKALRSDIRI